MRSKKVSLGDAFQSGQQTARKACAILAAKKRGFMIPSPAQKSNLLVAFAKKGKVVYGKAFDMVKCPTSVDLDDLAAVERNLKQLIICEIKSTKKDLKPSFASFFFALTGAEVLVAQSLKKQFRFVLVNTSTGKYLELSLTELFSKMRGIYPTWSISF